MRERLSCLKDRIKKRAALFRTARFFHAQPIAGAEGSDDVLFFTGGYLFPWHVELLRRVALPTVWLKRSCLSGIFQLKAQLQSGQVFRLSGQLFGGTLYSTGGVLLGHLTDLGEGLLGLGDPL